MWVRGTNRTRTRTALHLVFAVMLWPTASACVHVHAYQRERLAHPTMTTVGVDGLGAAHLHSVHEGATGGGSAAESGCGCN